jgi:hypothetical protein
MEGAFSFNISIFFPSEQASLLISGAVSTWNKNVRIGQS